MSLLLIAAAVVHALLSAQTARTCTIESTHVTVAGQTVTTPTIGYPCP
jgi:hypothetical protein